jgi:hypothetical protein
MVDRKLEKKAETMSYIALSAGQAATEPTTSSEAAPPAQGAAEPEKKNQRTQSGGS